MQIGRKRVNRREQGRKLGKLRRGRKSQSDDGDISRGRASAGRFRNERIDGGTRR